MTPFPQGFSWKPHSAKKNKQKMIPLSKNAVFFVLQIPEFTLIELLMKASFNPVLGINDK